MNKKRVIIIQTTTLDRSTRANKEIKTLTGSGYLVTLLCWDRGVESSMSGQKEAGDFNREIRVKIRGPWGSTIKTFPFIPIWWCFEFFWLMATKWDVAHAIQITSIPPAVIAGKLKRKPVIYEMLDTTEDEMVLHKVIRNIFIKVDKLFMWLASGVILADEMQIEDVGGIPNHKVVPVYDSPPDASSAINIGSREDDTFTIFYGGMLLSAKVLNLDKVFTAIKDIEDVKIIIAGYGDLTDEISEWSHIMPDKIQFIGEISHAEVLKRSAEANLLFMLRSPILIANKYICGSKVLEAMMCGTPIVVNKGTSTANIVREENCGLVVDANNIEEIREAIIKLSDNPELCEELGANGRKAYEGRYSWKIMEQRLLALYRELTGELGKRKKRGHNSEEN